MSIEYFEKGDLVKLSAEEIDHWAETIDPSDVDGLEDLKLFRELQNLKGKVVKSYSDSLEREGGMHADPYVTVRFYKPGSETIEIEILGHMLEPYYDIDKETRKAFKDILKLGE